MRQNLVVLMQAYAAGRGWSDATVSRKIHGNHAFLGKYRKDDMGLTVKQYFKMVQKMLSTWPDDAKMPETVEIKLGIKVAAPKK